MQLEVDAEVCQPAGQRNFNGFDYQAYLKTQGIYRTVKISTINKILPIHSWNIFDWLSTWRRQARLYQITFSCSNEPLHDWITIGRVR